MTNQVAFQLGLLSYVQFMQENSSSLTVVKIEQDVLILKVNLLKHITQLKVVSDFFDINNFQILNLQLDERELTSLLLGKKQFIYKKLSKCLKLNSCNPKSITFRLLNVLDNCLLSEFCKLTLDFRKNGG